MIRQMITHTRTHVFYRRIVAEKFEAPIRSNSKLMTSNNKYRYIVPVQVDYLYISSS